MIEGELLYNINPQKLDLIQERFNITNSFIYLNAQKVLKLFHWSSFLFFAKKHLPNLCNLLFDNHLIKKEPKISFDFYQTQAY